MSALQSSADQFRCVSYAPLWESHPVCDCVKKKKKKPPHGGDIVRHALHVSLTASSFRKCLKRRLGFKCHDRRDQAKRTVFIFWITLSVHNKRYLLFHIKNCICLEMSKCLCSEMFKLYKGFFKINTCCCVEWINFSLACHQECESILCPQNNRKMYRCLLGWDCVTS